jgi:transcriptional regulator with XRE-family HTH domain
MDKESTHAKEPAEHAEVASAVGLMKSVETTRAARGLSKADLAKRSHLPAVTVRRLLTEDDANPTVSTALKMLRSMGLGLKVVTLAGDPAASAPEQVRVWLARYGAPLYGSSVANGETVPRPEYVLAEALKLSHTDASVARTLTLVFWKTRASLDFAELTRLAVERGQGNTLGFFLDLTSELSGDRALKRASNVLRVRPSVRATQFFKVHSRHERRLADLKTPDVARRWNFRMNMSLDSFQSMFAKAAQSSPRRLRTSCV